MNKQLLKTVGNFLFSIGSTIWVVYTILLSIFNSYRLLLITISIVFILTGIMLILKYDSIDVKEE